MNNISDDEEGAPAVAVDRIEAILRDGEQSHVHEWTRCPTCPNPGQPCACSGVACCDAERQEIRAERPFSATCTGLDCGERFTDSETGEYEFPTRERMNRLLRADGWRVDPVLCPACQPEETS